MDYLKLFKTVGEIRNAVKKAHQQALSNRLSDDASNDLFEKLDKKLFSFEKGVVEVFDLRSGDYEYIKPGLTQPNEKVTKEFVYGLLVASKNTLVSLRDELKASDFRVVNKAKNDVEYLNNGVRSVLTKSITDMNKIVDIYAPEEDAAAE